MNPGRCYASQEFFLERTEYLTRRELLLTIVLVLRYRPWKVIPQLVVLLCRVLASVSGKVCERIELTVRFVATLYREGSELRGGRAKTMFMTWGRRFEEDELG